MFEDEIRYSVNKEPFTRCHAVSLTPQAMDEEYIDAFTHAGDLMNRFLSAIEGPRFETTYSKENRIATIIRVGDMACFKLRLTYQRDRQRMMVGLMQGENTLLVVGFNQENLRRITHNYLMRLS